MRQARLGSRYAFGALSLCSLGVASLALMTALSWTGSAQAQSRISIALGQSIEGELTDTDPRDENAALYDDYSIVLKRGDRVAVALDADDFDTMLRIGRTDADDFEELAANDDAPGHGLNSRITFGAPEDGTFVVRASALSSSGRGAYVLRVETAPPPAAAIPIRLGDRIEGRLNEDSGPGESGLRAVSYRFQGRGGQRLSILLSSDDFDTYLELFRERDGVVESLARDDDSGGDLNARISQSLPADGDYVIEARAFSDGVGDYVLELTETPPEPEPVALGFGQTLEGEITPSDPRDERNRGFDAYVLNGAQGRRVQIIMRSGDFDSYLRIGRAGEEFVTLADDDDGLGEGVDSRLTFSLPEDGDYVVRASPLSADGKGLYSIELADLGPEPEAGSILVGETARGTLSETDAMDAQGVSFDAYRIHLKTGDKVRITMVSNAFDAFVEVGRDEDDFEILASDDDGLSDTHARLDWTAEQDGWHVIRARSYSRGETGEYALTVERQP